MVVEAGEDDDMLTLVFVTAVAKKDQKLLTAQQADCQQVGAEEGEGPAVSDPLTQNKEQPAQPVSGR